MTDIYDVWFTAAFGTAISNAGRIADFGLSPKEIYEIRENLDFYPVFTEKQQKAVMSVSLSDVEKRRLEYEKRQVNSINYADKDFPKRMTGFDNMPLVLYYKGDLSIMSRDKIVSVVGSRRCNGEGEFASETISKDITLDGGVVASGLARGIDTLAHKSCTANGGKTIAFLGTPITQPYPKRNEDYQHYLETDHLVVSEYIPGTRYYNTNFISRNRLIRAVCDALCVIQATFKSGSLATVNRALDMGKTVWAIPGSIFSPAYEGSNNLLYEGKARALCNGHQIMAALGADVETAAATEPDRAKPRRAEPLTIEESLILDAIDGAEFSSEIVRKTGINRGVVRSALTEMAVKGLLVHTANGEYIKKK